MSRIAIKKIQKYSWFVRLFFFFQKKKYGSIPEPMLLWGTMPQVMLSFLSIFRSLNRKSSPLDPQLRALVCVKVSQINSCAFCVDMNSAFVLQSGGAQEKLNALNEFEKQSIYSNKERIALKYAAAMTQTHSRVDEALFEELRSNFNDDTIIELTALIAFQNMSSKFNSALDVQAFGFCQISKKSPLKGKSHE